MSNRTDQASNPDGVTASFLAALSRAVEQQRLTPVLFRWLCDLHDMNSEALDRIERLLEQRIALTSGA